MQATGTLYLSKTRPLATVAKDGTFTLTLLAYDRMGAHQVEAWRISYFGPQAQAFWAECADQLKPGQPITTTVGHMRSFSNGRFGTPETTGKVISIRLEPAQTVRKQLSKQEQTQAVAQAS